MVAVRVAVWQADWLAAAESVRVVGIVVTLTTNGAEITVGWTAHAGKEAVSVWFPSASVEIEKVAIPAPLVVAWPICVPPSKKVTMTGKPGIGLAVAVKVSGWPKTTVAADGTSESASGLILIGADDDLLPE